MCCKIDSSVVVFEEGEEEKVFYKVVTKYRSPPYYYGSCYHEGAVVLSNRTSKDLTGDEFPFREIDEGIHVLLHKSDAEKFKQHLVKVREVDPSQFVILSIKATRKDLIGSGYWIDDADMETAVFMKVTVLD